MALANVAFAEEWQPKIAVDQSVDELVINTNVESAEIADVTCDGHSVLSKPMNWFQTVEGGTSISISPEDCPVDQGKKAGEVKVLLVDGTSLDSEILAKASATCSTCAAGLWNATKCGGVTSTVGASPYPCCDNNGNGAWTDSGSDGNCTWYAWVAAKTVKGWAVPSNWGAAGNWCTKAASTSGWKVSTSPIVNSIACNSGHVAWVIGVSTDKSLITVHEQNCKCPSACFGSDKRAKQYSASSFKYITKL